MNDDTVSRFYEHEGDDIADSMRHQLEEDPREPDSGVKDALTAVAITVALLAVVSFGAHLILPSGAF